MESAVKESLAELSLISLSFRHEGISTSNKNKGNIRTNFFMFTGNEGTLNLFYGFVNNPVFKNGKVLIPGASPYFLLLRIIIL